MSTRLQILAAQTRKFNMHRDVDLQQVAQELPANVTGADIGAVTAQGFSLAMQRKLQQLTEAALNCSAQDGEAENGFNETNGEEEDEEASEHWRIKSHIDRQSGEQLTVYVTQTDLLQAARSVVPSAVDLAYYEQLGRVYEDDRVGEK